MTRILVTGAGGFIGSHLVERLLKNNYKVRAFLKYSSTDNLGWLNGINSSNLEIVYGDITDYDSILAASKNVEIIFNLAALISVPYSFKNPESFVNTNVKGLINLLRACKFYKEKIKKIIQISSSEVYGNTINKKIKILDENLKLKSESPYAASKIAADHLAITAFKTDKTPITIARPFNTFGPRQSLKAVIPTIITQLIKSKNKKIKIGNINSCRDFVYVEDTVNALVRIMLSKKTIGEVINIATEKSFSIAEIIEFLNSYTMVKSKIILEKKRIRNSELNKLCGSNKKIFKITNWRPKYSSKRMFAIALQQTYDWFKNPANLKNYKNINKYNI